MLRVACGAVGASTSTDPQTIDTGKGWRNKAVVVVQSFATAVDTATGRFYPAVGIWDGTNQFSVSAFAQSGVGTSNTNRGHNNGLIRTLKTDKSAHLDADGLVLNDGTGDFSLNWLTANASSRFLSWCAFGGEDLEAVKATQHEAPASTGTVNYDLGVRADAALVIASLASGDVPDGVDHAVISAGFLTRNQTMSWGTYSADNAAASSAYRDQRTDSFVAPGSTADAWKGAATLQGRNLEVVWATTSGAADFFVLAFQGPRAKAAAITSPNATTGKKTYGGFGSLGRFLFTGCVGLDHITANNTGGEWIFGLGTAGEGYTHASTDSHTADPTVATHTLDNDGPLVQRASASAFAVVEQASIDRFSADGPVMNFTTNSSNERESLLLQLGDRRVQRGRMPIRGRVSSGGLRRTS